MHNIFKNFSKIGWLILWIFIMTIYLFPFIWIIMTGFRQPIDTYTWPPKFIFTPTLDAFYKIFFISNVFNYMKGSFIIGLFTTILVIIFGAPAAYALSHMKMKGKADLLFSILIIRLIPAVSLVVPIFLIASKLGQIDKYPMIILVLTVFNLPFAIWLLRSFFYDIPSSIREAAVVDGTTEFGAFFRMILPISLPGILTTAIFTFIASWNEFLFVFVLSGRDIKVVTLLVKGFKSQYEVRWAQMGATTLVASIPIIIFAMIVQKYLVRGITMGAIK